MNSTIKFKQEYVNEYILLPSESITLTKRNRRCSVLLLANYGSDTYQCVFANLIALNTINLISGTLHENFPISYSNATLTVTNNLTWEVRLLIIGDMY